MSMLKMTDNMLWCCSSDEVIGFARADGRLDYTFTNIFHAGSYLGKSYICQFVLWKDFIICGYTYISNWRLYCHLLFLLYNHL